MDETALAAAIGARVRQERHDHGWTLDQLAASSGVSRRMIISVEQGEANPSVATLLKLSDALGIGLPALVQPPEPTPIQVIRAGTAPALWTGENGGRALLVGGTTPPDVVELWDWVLGPGDEHRTEAHSAGTWELLHILQGRLTLQAGDQTLTLEPGDAVTFPGDVPHAYLNPTDGLVRFALTVFEPGVGIEKGSR